MASFCVAATLLLGAVLPCSDALTVGQAGLMSPQTRNPVKLQRLFRQSEGVGEETQKVGVNWFWALGVVVLCLGVRVGVGVGDGVGVGASVSGGAKCGCGFWIGGGWICAFVGV